MWRPRAGSDAGSLLAAAIERHRLTLAQLPPLTQRDGVRALARARAFRAKPVFHARPRRQEDLRAMGFENHGDRKRAVSLLSALLPTADEEDAESEDAAVARRALRAR